MKNPWTKKNPLLSMFLSGANAVGGAMRGRATAQGKRQTGRLVANGIRAMTKLWTGGTVGGAAKKRHSR